MVQYFREVCGRSHLSRHSGELWRELLQAPATHVTSNKCLSSRNCARIVLPSALSAADNKRGAASRASLSAPSSLGYPLFALGPSDPYRACVASLLTIVQF